VRGKRFVVFGVPERLKHFASWVSIWSHDVTVVSPVPLGEEAERQLRVLDIDIVRDDVTGIIHADGKVAGVSTAGGGRIACDAVWVASKYRAASGLAASLCDVDELGFAKTDADGRTSKPGLFAIGNASNPVAHLAHAAAAGTNVGPIVALYLLDKELRDLNSLHRHAQTSSAYRARRRSSKSGSAVRPSNLLATRRESSR